MKIKFKQFVLVELSKNDVGILLSIMHKLRCETGLYESLTKGEKELFTILYNELPD